MIGLSVKRLVLLRSSVRSVRCGNQLSTMARATDPKEHKELLIKPNLEGLQFASKKLLLGQLVAFPTETVYGLGAHALNEDAVLSIFSAKDRPLTDPIIVHTLNSDSKCTRDLIDLSKSEMLLFDALADNFWPGPLTIIVKATNKVPKCVTAGTGRVGIRVPSHPLARALLEVSDIPIAAPSANRFGHISPTHSSHVLADLGHKNVYVLNGEYHNNNMSNKGSYSCDYGIESTVIEIDGISNILIIHRQGAIGQTQIQDMLNSISSSSDTVSNDMKWNILSSSKIIKMNKNKHELQNTGDISPRQAITHYAPNLPCYVIRFQEDSAAAAIDQQQQENNDIGSMEQDFKHVVIIDFNKQLLHLQ